MPNLEDLRDVAATAARGHNLVLVTPPSPAYASSVLAAVLGTLNEERRGLLLCPAAELNEWGALAHAAALATGARVQVAHGTARAMRRLKAGAVDLVITTPDTALALLQRAALKAESLAMVILAWPERWTPTGGEDPLTPLMQDLPKDSQRIIVTAASAQAQNLVERYARKALTIGQPTPDEPPMPPVGAVRTVSTPWSRRVSALADIVELLDPASLAVWTADTSRHDEIRRALPVGTAEIQLVTGDAPIADVIVAFDLPTLERVNQLTDAGEVVLLVPPSTERYVAGLATSVRPLRLPGLIDSITTEAGARRAAIVNTLDTGTPERALLTLAPLFERYDPSAVAAALFELWTAGAGGTAGGPGNVPTAMPDIPAIARVYIGIGKKDGVTVNDVVATLTKDVRVDRTKIGKIELRDSFTLVELPAQEAEGIARSLSGTTIRRKRIAARIDRGRERPGAGSGVGAGPGGRPPSRPRPPRPRDR